MAPAFVPLTRPGRGRRSTDDQSRAPMKRVGWIVSLAAALSSGAAWSQESFAALLLKNSLSFTLPRDYSPRSEEHTSELQSRLHLVCRLLLEKKNTRKIF